MIEDNDTRMRRGMAGILGELETLFANDEIGAVQINIARRDNTVRTLFACGDGFRMLLIAAAAIGHAEAVSNVIGNPEGLDWHAAGDESN